MFAIDGQDGIKSIRANEQGTGFQKLGVAGEKEYIITVILLDEIENTMQSVVWQLQLSPHSHLKNKDYDIFQDMAVFDFH